MSYLIDTNVLLELRRKQPDARVVSWMQARPRPALFLSVLTLGEIRKGIERSEDSLHKQSLGDWLEVELPHYFVGRLIGVDPHIADRWGTPDGPCGKAAASDRWPARRNGLATRSHAGDPQHQGLHRP